MTSFADQTYIAVATVKTFTDRHAFIQQQLDRAGWQADWIFDGDAVDLNPEDPRYTLDSLPITAASLIEKNRVAMQRFLNSGRPFGLILEDDAMLKNGITQDLEPILAEFAAIDGPAIMTLGGADDRVDRAFLKYPRILVPRRITTTEAVLMNRDAANRRLQGYLSKPISLPLDHLYQKLDPTVGVEHFWVKNPLVQQASQQGLLASTIDNKRLRAGGLWRVLGLARFYSKRFRKQWLPRLLACL